ncbi:hypothetical protein BOTBODRAFT_498542 [Botryobasidium botryosum FD-172 SS1]|uniref:Uncharacterized protein n=1 Tax=Botryobasidium botryosum (strain FD-172 SS1) TaxID=930990 RepID=A0A067M2Z9_BOTB1|nr:hypothetical protein BOTBODRAFT_498542 [Botryobasidium botryosum FD-172 SS1]
MRHMPSRSPAVSTCFMSEAFVCMGLFMGSQLWLVAFFKVSDINSDNLFSGSRAFLIMACCTSKHPRKKTRCAVDTRGFLGP